MPVGPELELESSELASTVETWAPLSLKLLAAAVIVDDIQTILERSRSSCYASEYDSQSRDPLKHINLSEPEKSSSQTLLLLHEKLSLQNQFNRVARWMCALPNGAGMVHRTGNDAYSIMK
jgi:hypothetical protein